MTKHDLRIPVDLVAAERELSLSNVEVRLSNRWSRACGSDAQLRNVNDGLLIGRIGIGDESALAEFYDRFAGIVYGLARRALGDAGAEEIVQETFFRVWSRASTYSPEKGSRNAWVMRIARNLIIDELSKDQRSVVALAYFGG